MDRPKRPSALAGLIAAGKADPITDEERAIVAELRAFYEKKYGGSPHSRSDRQSIPKSA
ncbi:hypothetical protein [Subtercola frigoramans]|uniref:Uncharacterized protein n=1 Tax=Subtercola frigoramans TaxID=120298 RepID=A0ABS2L7T2_9MICO|nr:hypothetical protein [Subtercola frigoramans]MBM7473163.1 hypothetical protein [Subtercola frigoramans]